MYNYITVEQTPVCFPYKKQQTFSFFSLSMLQIFFFYFFNLPLIHF